MNYIHWLTDNIHHSKKDAENLGYQHQNIVFTETSTIMMTNFSMQNGSFLIVQISTDSVNTETLNILTEVFEDLPPTTRCIVLLPINFSFAPVNSNNSELIQSAIMYENITVIAHSMLIASTQKGQQFNVYKKEYGNNFIQPITFQLLRTLIDCLKDNDCDHKIVHAVGKNLISLPSKSIFDFLFQKNNDDSIRKYTTKRKIECAIIDGIIEQTGALTISKSLPMAVQ